MTEITEIYSVRGDQEIRQGKLDYSETIDHRDAAEPDARRRCAADPTIRKVVYYRVREDGTFRTLYAYDNPNAGIRRQPRGSYADPQPRGRRTPATRKKGLVERLLSALRE